MEFRIRNRNEVRFVFNIKIPVYTVSEFAMVDPYISAVIQNSIVPAVCIISSRTFENQISDNDIVASFNIFPFDPEVKDES